MRVGVIGAGTMGQGIAQLAASSGAEVLVYDRAPAVLQELPQRIEAALKRRVEKNLMSANESKATGKRVQVTSSMKELSNCELIIEAVIEDLNEKSKLFKELEAVVAPTCLLATNTSSLSVTALAGVCKHPERVLGLHFFNPAPVLPLVEVVRALQSSPETLAKGEDAVRGWGKTPIRVQDTPGFVVNRVARPFYGEALRILDEQIADAATIDWAMQEFGKFRMGPFELMDFIGIDINYAVTESIFQAFYFEPRYRPSLSQRRLNDAKQLGRKTGKGFYDYSENATKAEPKRDPELGKKIFERVLALLINEAYEAVFWRVASVDAIEKAMVMGVNYPKGLFAWSEEWGSAKVLSVLEGLQRDYEEERYRPSVLLKRTVASGQSIFKGA